MFFFVFRRMTLGDDPIELMQGCLFTASYDGQLRGENLKTGALQKDIKICFKFTNPQFYVFFRRMPLSRSDGTLKYDF